MGFFFSTKFELYLRHYRSPAWCVFFDMMKPEPLRLPLRYQGFKGHTQMPHL